LKKELPRLMRYFFVGGISAVVDIGLFAIFASHFGLPWIPVSICTFIIGTLVNYLLSIRFVFKSGARFDKRRHEILGVFLISGLALLVNQSILFLSIEIFHWNLIFSKCLATGCVFFWNYFGRKRFVF